MKLEAQQSQVKGTQSKDERIRLSLAESVQEFTDLSPDVQEQTKKEITQWFNKIVENCTYTDSYNKNITWTVKFSETQIEWLLKKYWTTNTELFMNITKKLYKDSLRKQKFSQENDLRLKMIIKSYEWLSRQQIEILNKNPEFVDRIKTYLDYLYAEDVNKQDDNIPFHTVPLTTMFKKGDTLYRKNGIFPTITNDEEY